MLAYLITTSYHAEESLTSRAYASAWIFHLNELEVHRRSCLDGVHQFRLIVHLCGVLSNRDSTRSKVTEIFKKYAIGIKEMPSHQYGAIQTVEV